MMEHHLSDTTFDRNMTDIQFLHRERTSLEGKDVDFIFLQDDDFKTLMQGSPQAFIKEHQEEEIDVVLVGYPSLTSIVPPGVDFTVTTLQELYPNGTSTE